MALIFNPEHGLLDVIAPDGTLLGAVPATTRGRGAGNDAEMAYTLLPSGDAGSERARLLVSRREIAAVGGTPNAPLVRHCEESWSMAVVRHQRRLALARHQAPPIGANPARVAANGLLTPEQWRGLTATEQRGWLATLDPLHRKAQASVLAAATRQKDRPDLIVHGWVQAGYLSAADGAAVLIARLAA